MLAVASCATIDLDFWTVSTSGGTGGGREGTGGIAATTVTGTGSSERPECSEVDASACPPVPPGPCVSLGTVTCDGGKCGVAYAAGPAPSQVYGNCHQNVCDAAGKESAIEDDMNVLFEANPCLPYACVTGDLVLVPQHGTVCKTSQGLAGYCGPDPNPDNPMNYVCNDCDVDSGLGCVQGSTTCLKGKCVPPHCTDGVQNDGETDVDCGGGVCLLCRAGQKCQNAHLDCYSDVCPWPGVDGWALRTMTVMRSYRAQHPR